MDLRIASYLSDADFTVISEIVSCLQPLKFALNALCRYDTNLISAQSALQFCIVQLDKQSSELSKTLADVLVTRIRERYGTHSAILQYLHSPSATATAAVTDVFTIPSNDVIRKFIRRLVMRLEEHAETPDNDESNTASHSQSGTADNPDTQSSPMTTEKELKPAMQQSIDSTLAASGDEQMHGGDKKLEAAINAEMAVHKSSGKRGHNLHCAIDVGGGGPGIFGGRHALH